ncbi:conjugal transfer protein TraC (plasmid) [Rhizorhabdus wittichii DC-6]|nr:conjugal transfer protein TraC [Rhizorhabdus wittichii DC-6]
MRKTRDYDAELRALSDKAKALKAKKVQQLGELVEATGADALDLDVLAGALLHIIAEAQVDGNREAWRSDGAAFFQRRGRKAGRGAGDDCRGAGETSTGGAPD